MDEEEAMEDMDEDGEDEDEYINDGRDLDEWTQDDLNNAVQVDANIDIEGADRFEFLPMGGGGMAMGAGGNMMHDPEDDARDEEEEAMLFDDVDEDDEEAAQQQAADDLAGELQGIIANTANALAGGGGRGRQPVLELRVRDLRLRDLVLQHGGAAILRGSAGGGAHGIGRIPGGRAGGGGGGARGPSGGGAGAGELGGGILSDIFALRRSLDEARRQSGGDHAGKVPSPTVVIRKRGRLGRVPATCFQG